MPRSVLPLQWQLNRANSDGTPSSQWIPAIVPGAVQLDWARAHNLVDPRLNPYDGAWSDLDESPWIYRTQINTSSALKTSAGQRVFLILEGIDYSGEVRIDGISVQRFEGMQTPVHIDLTQRLTSFLPPHLNPDLRAAATFQIEVALDPAPKSRAVPKDRSQANASCKSAVGYGWDFHPRIIPLGLWRDAYLEVRNAVHFAARPELTYSLNETCDRITGHLTVNLRNVAGSVSDPSESVPTSTSSSKSAPSSTGPKCGSPFMGDRLKVRWTLLSPNNSPLHVVEKSVTAAAFVSPSSPTSTSTSTSASAEATLRIPFDLPLAPSSLWWPHDQGTPVLHTSTVELICSSVTTLTASASTTQSASTSAPNLLDRDTRQIGFRRVRLVMAPGEWDQPADFPKSRSRPPMNWEINGRVVFAKGSNWVCPDIFPGSLTPARYAEQLALVRASNMNLLRIWGGAGAPADCFYDECDRLGIMVWQDFPLACNLYPDTDAYLAVLDQESRSLITRLHDHPSVVLWCGGNELFNAWSRMTDQSLPLRLLNKNCFELDPSRPFIATAPIYGMGHGHYMFRDMYNGEEAWAVFQRSNATAYSEFACPGPASADTLRKIIPANDLFPPRAGTAWETRHAFGSWQGASWLNLDVLEFYFGPSESLEEVVERGQFLQAAGFQGLFEEARRQKPTAGMALNWCFNEPWACAANNSLVSWPCEPKPALASVAQACRPTLASARIRKFSWSPGEPFEAEIWLLNDAPANTATTQPSTASTADSACAAARAAATVTATLTVTAWLELDGQRQSTPLLIWPISASTLAPNTNLQGPNVRVTLPVFKDQRFRLLLEVEGHPDWNSSYTLVKSHSYKPPVVEAEVDATRALNA